MTILTNFSIEIGKRYSFSHLKTYEFWITNNDLLNGSLFIPTKKPREFWMVSMNNDPRSKSLFVLTIPKLASFEYRGLSTAYVLTTYVHTNRLSQLACKHTYVQTDWSGWGRQLQASPVSLDQGFNHGSTENSLEWVWITLPVIRTHNPKLANCEYESRLPLKLGALKNLLAQPVWPYCILYNIQSPWCYS